MATWSATSAKHVWVCEASEAPCWSSLWRLSIAGSWLQCMRVQASLACVCVLEVLLHRCITCAQQGTFRDRGAKKHQLLKEGVGMSKHLPHSTVCTAHNVHEGDGVDRSCRGHTMRLCHGKSCGCTEEGLFWPTLGITWTHNHSGIGHCTAPQVGVQRSCLRAQRGINNPNPAAVRGLDLGTAAGWRCTAWGQRARYAHTHTHTHTHTCAGTKR